MNSYRKINYSLRPAKHIERKMLCETFRRLAEFAKVESYRYIGFGSIYFSDFLLFHKTLGFSNMLSIERDLVNEARFAFNRPFKCIKLEFGESNEILPKLPWDVRTILWLDYDGQLNDSVLTDVAFFCANACSSSMILVTVNAQFNTNEAEPIQKLKDRVGSDKVPSNITLQDLGGWKTADVYRRIVENEILETLSQRNGGRPAGSKFQYKQLFNFRYSDGAKMLTVGGLLHDEGQSPHVEKCAFETLHFVRSGFNPYFIEVPNLTYREIRHLDTQLPNDDYKQLLASAIPENDLEKYARVYRYFPAFAEADM